MASFPVRGNAEFVSDLVDFPPQPGTVLPASLGAQSQHMAGNAMPRKQTPNPFTCDICAVHCSSQATLNEHLAGQKHRKREAAIVAVAVVWPEPVAVAADASVVGTPSPAKVVKTAAHNVIFCDLCNVSCCGPQVFAGHIQGAKHQKALKLQSQVNKQSVQPMTAARELTPASNAPGGGDNIESKSSIIGEEFVSMLTNDAGNVVGFHCKLCDCTLTDPNGRIAHLKGRRHRLAFKNKVDSRVHVDIKPNSRTARIQEIKEMRRFGREEHWRKLDAIAARFYGDGGPHAPGVWFNPGFQMWGHNQVKSNYRSSIDDRYIFAKRDEVRLPKEEIDSIYAMAVSCEKALKLVSDIIAKEDNVKIVPSVDDAAGDQSETKKAEPGAEAEKLNGTTVQPAEQDEKLVRVVRGVMRVGRLATGIFLQGDNEVDLVVLAKDKPTWSLLERIASLFTDQLAAIAPGVEFKVQTFDDGCIRVVREAEPKLVCIISLTSPSVRHLVGEDGEGDVEPTPDPEDMLPKEKCLDALAQLRRVKWFQAQELLVEKCICYAGLDRGPGEILRTIFECVASGLLTSDGPGLYDPCEKDPVDVTGDLNQQQREDITAAAQQAMRLIAYRQLYKVLDLKQFPRRPWQNKSKRGAGDNTDEAQSQEKRPKVDLTDDASAATAETNETPQN